jgi:uncharacterized membrane protein YhaH (DUF805 family)
MLSTLKTTYDRSWFLILIAVIAIVTVVDSNFVKVFYGTNLDSPGSFHIILFVSFVIASFLVNFICLHFTKGNDKVARRSRPTIVNFATYGTFIVQCAIVIIFVLILFQIAASQEYNKLFILLVIYLSHFWSAIMLITLSITFMQWFKFARSISILIYAVVFLVILFLIVISIPLLTEQYSLQTKSIYPRSYTGLVLDTIVPSTNIAFIFGLSNYVLPVMIVASWTLAVSLFRAYSYRIGRKKFWIIVTIPLIFQLVSFVLRDPDLITDPNVIQLIYSQQFQIILGIGYQISGLFFAAGFVIIGIKMRQRMVRSYLIISAIGIAALFSSIQPGMPFYAAYPPFGLVSLIYLGLSAFMLLVGILGTVIYVSTDSELRREISRGLDRDSDVLKKMGSAEIQREVERRILPIADKVITPTENWIDYMDEDRKEDLKVLIEDVINETRLSKNRTKESNEQ